MNSRDHLAPSRTVDKNGKATTVYRKLESATREAASIPAPAMPSSRAVRQGIIDAVWEPIQDGIARHKIPSYKDKMTDVYRNLSAPKDDSYPLMVSEMVSTVMPTANAIGTRAVLMVIAEGDEDSVGVMHAHRDYLAANPKNVSAFVSMMKILKEQIDITPDEDGRIPTIEAHLYAKNQWDNVQRTGEDSDKPYYRNVPDVIAMVEKHPNEVAPLMDLFARGQENVTMEVFEEYLSQGAVREGSL